MAVFNAVAERPEETKVSINDYVLSWESGDKILVNDGSVDKIFTAQGAGSSASFSAEGVVLVSDKTYVAAYPQSTSIFYDGALKMVVEDEFLASAGEYPIAPAVAVGNGADKNLEFKNVCALISFEVTGSNVLAVTVKGGNDETLAGMVTVDPQTAEFTIAEEYAKKQVVVTSNTTVLFPGKYYVPVLPADFTNGLTLSMTLSGADAPLVRDFGPVNLQRSHYYDLEMLDGGRFVRYEISTAEQLQQFLEDAASCKSYVTATLEDDINLDGVELPSAESYAGFFDGQGFSLKNWTSSKPLFQKLNAGASVKNLTLASSCSFTLSETDTPYQALVVARNEGTVTGCVNKGQVTYTAASALKKRTFGTIVGYSTGVVEDCHNEGNIVLNLSSAESGADQKIGGVVGAFSFEPSEEAVKACINTGNITVEYASGAEEFVLDVAGVCAAASATEVPAEGATSVNAGTVRQCENSGAVTVNVTGEQSGVKVNVGGVAAYLEANLDDCSNAGAVTLTAESAGETNVGGVAAAAVAGNVLSCTNEAPVILSATTTAASSMGGVVGKAGEAAENTSYNIKDCVNAGNVTAELSGPSLDMGGIAGWTSIPMVGSDVEKLINRAAVSVTELAGADVNLGGVVGKSISTFDKAYTKGDAAVTLALSEEWNKTFRVGGIAGYMFKASTGVFKQAQNYAPVTISGGASGNTNKCYAGGCVGSAESTAVTSNSTSWVTCNSNYAKITVNSPVVLYVGGVAGCTGKGSSVTSEYQRCKNGGSIEVTSPADGSCIGGVFGYQYRGSLGNANTQGSTNYDDVCIKVTGATVNTYVGGYVGMMYTDHGKASSYWYTIRFSGCSIRGSIDAEGASAGVVAGCVKWSGKSTSNCMLLGSNENERPKIAKNFTLNGATMYDAEADALKGEIKDYFAVITPSTNKDMTHIGPDDVAMKGRYLIFAAGDAKTKDDIITDFREGLLIVD